MKEAMTNMEAYVRGATDFMHYAKKHHRGVSIYEYELEDILIKFLKQFQDVQDNRRCANCGRHDGWNGCGEYVEDCMQDYDVYSNWIPKENKVNYYDSKRVD